MNTIKIAAAQSDIFWEDVPQNLAGAREMILSSDADVVILPEMFATGFSMDSRKIAQKPSGEIVTSMTAIAREAGRAVVFSAAIEEDGKIYNRLYFITPEGECSTYNKRHLFRMAGENENYSAGDERLIVEYKGFRICLMVCYDLRFPVFSRNSNCYDVLVYIASWPSARSYAWNTLLRARAIENQCYTVGVNRVGNDPKNVYSGSSVILDFMGQPIVEAKDSEVDVVSAELSMEKLTEYKKNFAAYLDADKFEIINTTL